MSSRLVALLVTTVLAGAGSASAEEIAGGEVRRHAFQLAAGEALDAVVEQEGIDLVVELRDARDAVLMTVDSPNGARGPEPLLYVTESGGRFVLVVRGPDNDAPSAGYSLRSTIRKATTADRSLAEERTHLAVAWVERAAGLRAEPGASAHYLAALRAAELALGLATRRVGDSHLDVAAILDLVGYVEDEIGDYAAGRATFERALDIRRRLGANERDLRRTESDLAFLEMMHGELASAESRFRRILRLDPALDDASHGLLLTLEARGDWGGAQELVEQQLAAVERHHGATLASFQGPLSRLLRLQARRGDLAAARATAKRLEPIEGRGVRAANALEARAELALAEGDAATAERLAFSGRQERAAALGAEHPGLVAPLLLEAQALTRLGRWQAAQARLRDAGAIAARRWVPQHPVLGQLARLAVELDAARRAASRGAILLVVEGV